MNQEVIKILQQFSLCTETHGSHLRFYMPDLYRSVCSSNCDHIKHCKLCSTYIHFYKNYDSQQQCVS